MCSQKSRCRRCTHCHSRRSLIGRRSAHKRRTRKHPRWHWGHPKPRIGSLACRERRRSPPAARRRGNSCSRRRSVLSSSRSCCRTGYTWCRPHCRRIYWHRCIGRRHRLDWRLHNLSLEYRRQPPPIGFWWQTSLVKVPDLNRQRRSACTKKSESTR
jgi:hypothetical protein